MSKSIAEQKAPLRVATTEAKLPNADELSKAKRGVLLAALEQFAWKGYGSTSIRDIAQSAGIKSASLYNHYKSKEEILATLIEIGHVALFRRLRSAVINASASPEEQLRAFVAADVRAQAEYAMLAVVVNHELHQLGSEYIAPAMTLRAQSVELFFDILKKGREQGCFTATHPPELAASAIGAMCIRVAEWYSPEHIISISQIENTYADYALGIVGFRPSEQ